MAPAGLIAASLLLVFTIALGASLEASAASPSVWTACGRGDRPGKGCASRRSSSGNGTAAYLSARATRRVWGRPRLYRGDEGTISQLSPRLRPRRISRLRFDRGAEESCGRGRNSRRCVEERNLAEALVQPPNPATERLLREHGIPVIPGVPPIVTLKSAVDNWGFSTSP